jgi:hypothetical protein
VRKEDEDSKAEENNKAKLTLFLPPTKAFLESKRLTIAS